MALFGFKSIKPTGFSYQPRFYDQKKEAFQERLKQAKLKSGDDPEAQKLRIRSSLKRKSGHLSDRSYRSQKVMRSNMLLLLIIVLLALATLWAIEVYLPDFLKKF